MSAAEQAAIARAAMGLKVDPKTLASAKKKLVQAEKYRGERNKKKRGTQKGRGQSSRSALATVGAALAAAAAALAQAHPVRMAAG